VLSFIEDHLPESFDGAGFHWQLSSSAGHARNAGVLKAHVWFWLNTPMTCAELTVWSDTIGPAIDRTLYRVVQVHYTALPVFAPGVVDPVPRRCGLVAGPAVTLVLDNVQRALADTLRTRDATGGGRELADPRLKTGVVGAFCRAYSIESLLEPGATLSGQFEYERGSDRRLTWLQGGGAVGGAYITDDRLHLCNTHNTSPNGPSAVNAFDAVRIYCFGHLDAAADPLALVEMRTRPSYREMCNWAMGLAPVRDAVAAENSARMTVPTVATDAGSPPVAPVPAAPPATAAAAAITGETLLFPAAQVGYFAGCIYIAGLHRVMAPDGQMYDQQRFNAVYGGRSFVMDPTNSRTIRSAWECFLESQAIAFPKVDACAFRPELPAGAIITLEGRRYVNMYSPIETRQVEGDPEPFLRLMRKMLPNARDKDIMLTYMASMIRNPGVKFQWWPVLQGAEGNGKTAFIRLLQHCIGKRYSHLPNTGEMAKNGIKFNAWIVACLFLGFEEIYVPGRREFLEELKPVVTNDSLQVERKGVDQTMEDNRANGLMCTNHEDGVPVTTDTRRYAVFYTAQQRASDKLRDGMTGDYFRDFYDWCYGRGAYASGGENYGFSVMNWWLRTQYILVEEFDPAGVCQVAPKTSSSDAAIRASLGPVEQEILEAIESEQQGFRNGWISSVALDRLMEKTGKRIARNQRRHILQALGYDWHPHLKEGRTTHGTLIDGGGKFRLYVKVGHSDRTLIDGKAIIDKYLSDQQ
jgi:hypothetical protein